MDVLVFVFILIGTIICSSASKSPETNDKEFGESLNSGMEASSVRSPNFSQPILETVEKKKHLLFVLEEEEQDRTFLPVDLLSEPNDDNLGNEGQRFHYSSTLEDQLQMFPSSVDQQLVNGTDGSPQPPSIMPSNHNYIIPILLCLALLFALLILFTQYFKWTDDGNYQATDYNFFFFKRRATEVPPAPDV